jgi:hypothetical protein
MIQEPKTISEHIECLARLTGAPTSFVDQVRALFTSKGISLEEEATPFVDALDEAFRREESIRCSTYRARQNLAKIQESFKKVGQAYVEQIGQLKKIHPTLQDPSRRARPAAPRSRPTRIAIRGDHRTFVMRAEREDMPLVPGPQDPQ